VGTQKRSLGVSTEVGVEVEWFLSMLSVMLSRIVRGAKAAERAPEP
jgi:hypothetical protein